MSYPKTFLHDAFPNMVHYHDMPRGGHFAAFEEPELVVNDIRSMVNSIEIAKANTKGN